MSILMQNDEIIILSHENYVNNVFESVHGSSFVLNSNLFDINEPFKSYETHPKKKKRARLIDVKDEEGSYPARLYKKYSSEIKKCLSALTLEKQNQKSAGVSSNENASRSTVPTEDNSQIQDGHDGTAEDKTTKNNRKRGLTDDTNDTGKDKQYQPPNINALETVSRLQKLSSCNLSKFNGCNTFPHSIKRAFNGVDYLFPPNSNFISSDVTRCNLTEKFDVILMDPPWTNKAIRRKNKKQLLATTGHAHGNGYSFMNNDDIEQLPIDAWLKQDGVVFVWCTNSAEHRQACARFFTKWKLQPAGLWHWLKVTKQGEPIIPFTREELHMKQPYEAIAIGARGDSATKWRAEMKEKLVISVPSAMHSHKPPLDEIIRAISKQHLGDSRRESEVTCLEVFARYLLPGWTSLGNEVLKFQNACFYTKR